MNDALDKRKTIEVINPPLDDRGVAWLNIIDSGLRVLNELKEAGFDLDKDDDYGIIIAVTAPGGHENGTLITGGSGGPIISLSNAVALTIAHQMKKAYDLMEAEREDTSPND